MRLEGSLDAFSLPDIFALLSMTKKTGGLHLRRDGEHGVVWVADGALTGGSTAAERQGLARRVVTSVGIDRETLQKALELSKGQDIGVVAALSRNGAVEESVLREIASEHIVDVVFDLLRWEQGDFEFVVDESDRDDLGVTRMVDDVVTEARQRLQDWESVRDTLPQPAAVLALTSTPNGEINLDRDQWSMLVLVDGRRTVLDLVRLSGRGEYAAARCLADLIELGVLCEASDAGVPAVVERLALLDEAEGIAPQPVVETAAVNGANGKPAAVAELGAPFRGPRDLSRVTPQRPEPFRPSRAPEHPDTPASAPTVGALATATAPSTHIERDPSVNKSLLLRLIAGVRGL